MSEPSFGFLFVPPDGEDHDDRWCGEGDTLAGVLEANPRLRGLELGEVWCLRSANLIWASEGDYHDGPWKEPEPTNG